MNVAILETDRLIMRPWQDADYAPFAALNADPRVMKFMPHCLSPDESNAWADRIRAHFDANGFGLWALEEKETARFIGFTGLQIPRFEAVFTPCVEIGWRIAHEFWGRGYATEAAKAAANQGFNVINLQEILSFTVPDNVKSRRVMEKLGMRHNSAEDFAHPVLPPGHRLERHVLYRLKKEDFYAHHAP